MRPLRAIKYFVKCRLVQLMYNSYKKFYAWLNIARQTELMLCHRLARYCEVSKHLWQYWFGKVQWQYWHLWQYLILKNRTKSKLDCILWVIGEIIKHNRSNFASSKLVLTGVCCKHFMYTCMHFNFVYTFLCARGVRVYLYTLWSHYHILTSKIPTGFF